MIIKALRDYISQCPYLYEFNKGINIDYLDNDSTTYSIEEVPCEPIIKRYINGDTKRQYDFIFASRESYGADVFQNIENSGFYEDFSSWIEEESSKGNLSSSSSKYFSINRSQPTRRSACSFESTKSNLTI